MASNYPTSLDNFTNPTSNDSLNSPSHSLQHANINDAVEAIEAKLGIGASTAGSATSGQVLTAGTGGTTTWQTLTIPEPGMTLISSHTITTQSTVDFTNCFTSTYRNYRILFDGLTVSTNLNLFAQLLNGSTPVTTGYYYGLVGYTDAATLTGNGSANASSIVILDMNSSNGENASFAMDIFVPQIASRTKFNIVSVGMGGAGNVIGRAGGGIQNNQTAYDGLRLNTGGAGTFGGILRIYGYQN